MALANNVQTFDSLAAQTEILQGLLKTSRVHAPLLTNYMSPVQTLGSRLEWFDQALPTGEVTLDGAYTAGAGSMVLDTPTLINGYSIKENISQVQTESGSAIYDITAYNSGTDTITISLVAGSDANLADGTTLKLTRNDNIGADFGSHSDVFYATSDYNYISNMSYTIKIANPQANGQLKYHIDELSFANQLENNTPDAIRTLEVRVLKDIRTAGTNGAARNGNTIQAGDGSRAGGILNLANARGLYTASAGSTPLVEDILETDVIALRDRGAFTTIGNKIRSYDISTCKAYCSEQVLADLNKSSRLQRAPEVFLNSQKGTPGSSIHSWLVNSVVLQFEVSDACSDNEIIYVPRDDLIEVKVLRLLEEQPNLGNGDNEKRMYTCTWTTTVKNPWLLGHRTNLVRL